MANCTISTMEVNDCHLQFFDSLGNLIYEFDLETIIALNNGNGILIKDELTTLTIDKTIVVENLTMTIAELITYIQEQRVLCTCECATPVEDVTASTEWGYSSDNDKVFIITNANGNTRFESPIGTPYIPTSDVLPISGKVGNFVLVSLTSSGSGSTIDGAHRVVFSWDSNSTPTINGVVQINTGGQSLSCKIFDATILGDGRYVGVPSISFDGSAGAIVIDQLIL